MSDEENKVVELETEQKVKLGKDDAEAIRSFYTVFKIPPTPELEAAIDTFKNDPTYYNQQLVKYHVSKWITESEHPALKHQLFALPRENALKQLPPLEFDFLMKKKLDE